MRGTTLPRTPSRIKGGPALERRLHGLLLAVHRFARHRAATPEDRRWAAAAVDGLQAIYQQLTALHGPPRTHTDTWADVPRPPGSAEAAARVQARQSRPDN
jgi:hypothetical protein